MHQNHLTYHQTLKCNTPIVQEYPDITETPVQQMIINRTWRSLTIPMHSQRSFVVEPQTSLSYSFYLCDNCNIQDLRILDPPTREVESTYLHIHNLLLTKVHKRFSFPKNPRDTQTKLVSSRAIQKRSKALSN
jgi:hypothetical protein